MYWQKFLSRKFLLPLLLAVLAYLKGTGIIQMDTELIVGLIAAVLAFIGFEGWADVQKVKFPK